MNRLSTSEQRIIDDIVGLNNKTTKINKRSYLHGGRPEYEEDKNTQTDNNQNDVIEDILNQFANNNITNSIVPELSTTPIFHQEEQVEQQNQELSDTSVENMNSLIMQEAQIPSVEDKQKQRKSSVMGKTMFHIIFDTDFGKKEQLTQEHRRYTGEIQTFLNKDMGNRIPLVDSIEDARKISEHLVYDTIQAGTTKGKKFPAIGAIILGYKMTDLSVDEEGSIDQKGGRDYNSVFNFLNEQSKDKDIIMYSINKKDGRKARRALITQEALAKCELATASYGYITSTPKQIGFALFNHMPDQDMSTEDIKILSNMYNNYEDKNYKHEFMVRHDVPLPEAEKVNNEKLEGGYYKKYKQEKKRYLQLKEIARQRGIVV